MSPRVGGLLQIRCAVGNFSQASDVELLWLKTFLIITAGWVQLEQSGALEYLLEENRVLRAHLGDQRIRFTDAQRRRLARKGHALGRGGLEKIATLARPDAVLGWYRKLVARKYDGSKRRKAGRPKPSVEIRELVITMANENPTWGYTRIRGALQNLGHTVARSTIAKILSEAGLDPAPDKPERWSAFLKARWGCDQRW